MKTKKKLIRWRRVDPQLLQAALCPDKDRRALLMERIAKHNNMSVITLQRRLEWLGYRCPSVKRGYAAVDEWEKEMLRLIEAFGSTIQLYVAVTRRAYAVREIIRKAHSESVTIAEAASYFGVPRKVVRAWCEQMELIERDGDGRIPLKELRRFFTEEGWWLIKSYKYLRKTKELK